MQWMKCILKKKTNLGVIKRKKVCVHYVNYEMTVMEPFRDDTPISCVDLSNLFKITVKDFSLDTPCCSASKLLYII